MKKQVKNTYKNTYKIEIKVNKETHKIQSIIGLRNTKMKTFIAI